MPARSEFTLDDFVAQMAQVKKLGPMGRVMGLIPGTGDLMKQVNVKEGEIERSLGRMRAIYDSMTRAEREAPEAIDLGRRRRIARGAGVAADDVLKFLTDFRQSRDVTRAVGNMGMTGLLGLGPAGPPRVLGLVGDDPDVRDPSYVHDPAPKGPMLRLLPRAIVLTALAALAWNGLRQ